MFCTTAQLQSGYNVETYMNLHKTNPSQVLGQQPPISLSFSFHLHNTTAAIFSAEATLVTVTDRDNL